MIIYVKIALISQNVLLREDLQTDVKNSNFKKFEITLYMKSLNMLLYEVVEYAFNRAHKN